MQHLIALSLFASMAAMTAAVPLGHSHHMFHTRRHNEAPIEVAALAQRDGPAVNLDLENGTCGGSTGFGCATGFCCSQWGYCGQGADYCGGSGGSQTSTQPLGTSVISIGTPKGAGGQNTPFVQSQTTAVPQSSIPTAVPTAATTGYASAPTLPSAATTYVPTTTVAPTQVATTAPTTALTTQQTSAAAPAPSSSAGSGGSGFGNVYKMYTGNGDSSAGWPTTDNWVSFDTMWANNEPNIMVSCSQFDVPNNSEAETADLQSAILSVGSSAGVDPRFILAVVLQESAGCVRAPTTNYGVTNPGLMQDHDGTGSCNNGQVLNPCPSSQITQMIQDGTDGTSSGDGLKQCLAQAPSTSGAAQYYQAARIYNSGSIAPGGNLDAGIATLCYSADIANRLTGWYSGANLCNL